MYVCAYVHLWDIISGIFPYENFGAVFFTIVIKLIV